VLLQTLHWNPQWSQHRKSTVTTFSKQYYNNYANIKMLTITGRCSQAT